ncbi:MAG: sulfoxide reductase heme-binding subunit YedZ [Chloroflexi bacterium]|nr:sulfoxide reductase heme-binding subunit YedZ [Chloroflexota bacterium]
MPTISKTKPIITWLQTLIHILGWLPLAWILYLYFAGKLSVNPIQDIEQQLGHIAVYFLIASLACTPLYTLSGWREPLKRRRALGLYCFMYAGLHVLTFTGLDYGFNLHLILGIVLKKPYAIVGLVTFILLLPLAVTSFRWWMKKLGRKWTKLHRLVYLAGVLDILHYAWSKKGNLFTLSGDILQPLLWGLLLLLLLALRLPQVRRWASSLRQRPTSVS